MIYFFYIYRCVCKKNEPIAPNTDSDKHLHTRPSTERSSTPKKNKEASFLYSHFSKKPRVAEGSTNIINFCEIFSQITDIDHWLLTNKESYLLIIVDRKQTITNLWLIEYPRWRKLHKKFSIIFYRRVTIINSISVLWVQLYNKCLSAWITSLTLHFSSIFIML